MPDVRPLPHTHMQHKRLFALLLLPLLVACTKPVPQPATSRPAPPAAVVAAVQWPPLPASGFVSGRPATNADVAAGRAAFSLQAQGVVIGKPTDVTVPQYAFLVEEGSKRTPGIVIQAEVGQGIRMLGFRPLTGGALLAALESEFELLGTTIPSGHPPKSP